MTLSRAEIIEARRDAAHADRAARQRARRERADEVIDAVPMSSAGSPIARFRFRHLLVLTSFMLIFLIPCGLLIYYLHFRAADQYISRAQLSVQRDGFVVPTGIIDQILAPESSEATDTDILFDYIHSQRMVEAVDAKLNLRQIYRRQSENDPVFGFGKSDAIEDLVEYWRHMIDVTYESRQGIIGIRARAFTPDEALSITRLIVSESHRLINALSDAAREDKVRFAREDLDEARKRLEDNWAKLREFRHRNRVILPTADAQVQIQVIGALTDTLNGALVDRAQLVNATRAGDARLAQLDRRISAIGAQILQERAQLANTVDSSTGKSVVEVLSAYEALQVDVEFARKAYVSALASFELARVEARRINRFISVHVAPTLPERSQYPERWVWTFLAPLLLFVLWAITVFIGYNIRDRN